MPQEFDLPVCAYRADDASMAKQDLRPVDTDRLDPSTSELTVEAPSLAQVRRWLGDVLSDLGEDERDDCVLVLNELVSNAYDHGGGPRGIRLRRTSEPCLIRVEVADGAPDLLTLGRSRLGVDRGRGLTIVDALCKDWGVQARDDGKAVWAELLFAERG